MSLNSNIRLIATNSHPELAKNIAEHLQLPLVDSEIQYFANGEIRTVIRKSLRKKDIFIIGTGVSDSEHSVNDYIMEVYFTAVACQTSDARSITVIFPQSAYQRQEKKDNPRGCISARAIANLFERAGITRIVFVDLHTPAIQGFYDIPADNLYARYALCDHLEKFYGKEHIQQNFVVISPDFGALKLSKAIAGKLGIEDYLVISKERLDADKNKVMTARILGDTSLLKDKTAFIYDDMCDTAGTITAAADLLIENGAKDVVVAVTHGILSHPAIQRLNDNKSITAVFVSDSVPQQTAQQQCSKLFVYSISQLLAETIKRLSTGQSLSELFE